jgi:hypothetical protein
VINALQWSKVGNMDKRQYLRLLLDTDVEYSKSCEKASAVSRSKDISLGGVCITTSENPLPMGELCDLSFILPGNDDPIRVKGKVMWNREYDTGAVKLYDNGIEFVDLKDDYVQMINEYSIGTVEG